MFKYLFGPVPSRRLGMSLGVDLVPKKVCSLDCVYCEVGKTSKLTTELREYIPLKKIQEELDQYFSENPDPDYITFSGSGEPTLNSEIGEVLQFIKKKKPHIPTALLSNGTMFFLPDVREAVREIDLILPSLDAATEEVFKKINRPADGLTLQDYIQGLIKFKENFKGKMWLEVFILPSYNDSKQELLALKEIILQIKPDRIQLNTLDRPGTIPDIRGASRAEMNAVVDLWALDNVEIISAAPARKNIQSYRKDTETAILETISRRPCTLNDLVDMLGLHVNEVNKYLDVLDADDKVELVHLERGTFYQLKHKNN